MRDVVGTKVDPFADDLYGKAMGLATWCVATCGFVAVLWTCHCRSEQEGLWGVPMVLAVLLYPPVARYCVSG